MLQARWRGQFSNSKKKYHNAKLQNVKFKKIEMNIKIWILLLLVLLLLYTSYYCFRFYIYFKCIFLHCKPLYWYKIKESSEPPCEMEQTEAGMPLYLFQVSAHSRPVALQRKPRYSTLAKRKEGGYFRGGFRWKTCTDLFVLSPSSAASLCGSVRSSGGG